MRAMRSVVTTMKTDNKAHTTIQHEAIKAWAEERGGKPARVRGTGDKKRRHFKYDGILSIDFGTPEENLEPIGWQEFFKILDEHRLAFLFQEETADGKMSRFCKFVRRKT